MNRNTNKEFIGSIVCYGTMVALLLFALMGCSKSSSSAPKNFNQTPQSNYTGVWVVYATNSGLKWIEANYVNGRQQGVETRWYPDSGCKMSLHTFEQGILDGKAIKYRNNSPGNALVEGVYKSGQPWEGAFLEGLDGELDKSLDVVARTLPYWVREYNEGKVTMRGRC